ncbi:MAG: ribonuclease III family protein [Candidatus Bathyarchaeota archaeon]
MKARTSTLHFVGTHKNLGQILEDRQLASLGDIFVNLVCSLVISNRKGRPVGAKIKGSILAEAVKRSGLREYMPPRTDKHALADAAEALVVYGWLHKHITLEECLTTLEMNRDIVYGLSKLLQMVQERIIF